MASKKRDLTEYNLADAISKVKENSKEKFDASVELHINLNKELKKQDQSVRFSVTPPHDTGKEIKVAVLASTKVPEADLELNEIDLIKIEKGKIKPKTDFEILVTEPAFMSKVAKVAKILGPAGVMPNPKTGTVTDNAAKTVKQIKKGRVEVRTEKDIPVIHTILGKVSFENKKLIENAQEILSSLKQNKPAKIKGEWIQSAYVCSSMGPSVKIDVMAL